MVTVSDHILDIFDTKFSELAGITDFMLNFLCYHSCRHHNNKKMSKGKSAPAKYNRTAVASTGGAIWDCVS